MKLQNLIKNLGELKGNSQSRQPLDNNILAPSMTLTQGKQPLPLQRCDDFGMSDSGLMGANPLSLSEETGAADALTMMLS